MQRGYWALRHLGLSILVLASSLGVSKCDAPAPYPVGHFEGSLLRRHSDSIHQKPVCTDITENPQGGFELVVTDASKQSVMTLTASKPSHEGFSLLIPEILSQPIGLVQKNGCYVAEQQEIIRFCYSPQKFLLEVMNSSSQAIFTLSGDRLSHAAHFELESPRPITLDNAIETAMRTNFSSRIAFEQLMQARHTAKAAYLGLIPHLSLQSILSNLTPTAVTVFSAIGDLVPFLLPSRWFQAKQAGLKTQVNADALVLMQANLASNLEGLSYTLSRDEQFLMAYKMSIEQLTQVEQKIRPLESSGQLPEGSTDTILAQVDSLLYDQSALEQLIRQDKAVLSGLLGFHNPEAISSLVQGEELLPIAQAIPLDPKVLYDSVVHRSFELRQMDALIQLAHLEKSELAFNWLDPSGRYDANLGFGLPETILASQSEINALLVKREQVQTELVSKFFIATQEYNSSLLSYAQLTNTMNIHQRRLKLALKDIGTNPNMETHRIGEIIQAFTEAILRGQTILADFRVARSKIDRFLLQGFYTKVPQLEDQASISTFFVPLPSTTQLF